ncbi:16769_t:CDS:2, partial [Entrophospora sp. SA101]
IEEHEEEKQKIIFKFTSQLKEKHEPVKNNEQGQKNNYQQLLLDKEKEYDDLLNKFNLHTKEYNLMKENYNTVIKRISVIGEWVNSNIDNNNLSNLSNNKVEDIVELLKVFDKLEKIIELKKAELEGLEIIKKENNKLNDLIDILELESSKDGNDFEGGDCGDNSDDDEDYIPNGDVIEEREDTSADSSSMEVDEEVGGEEEQREENNEGSSSRSPTSNRRALRSRNGNGVIVNGHINNNPNHSNGSVTNNITSRYNFLTQSPMIGGGPFNNSAPNHQLKKLDVPFQIFSESFNRYHDDQERELQSLVRLERHATKKCHEVDCELDKSRREIDAKKNNLKLINDQNKLIREQIENIHHLIIPICQQVSDELDDLTIGPFLAKFVKN